MFEVGGNAAEGSRTEVHSANQFAQSVAFIFQLSGWALVALSWGDGAHQED